MRVKSTTEVRNDGITRIGPADLAEFLSALPDDCQLDPIMADAGSQRDPDMVMIGMRATWYTDR